MSRPSWLFRSAPSTTGTLAACLLGFLVTGCVTPSFVDRAREEEPSTAVVIDPVVYQVHESFRKAPPRCVAVLPFKSQTETDADGAAVPTFTAEEVERVRRALFAHLAPQRKRDLELERIDATLEAMPASERDDLRAVGQALACEAVMTGTVTRCGSAFLGLYSRVHVGAEVKILRTRDGELLWEGRHQAVSHAGFMPLSIVGAALGLVDAAVNMRAEQLDRVTDDLARRLVSTIPDEADYRYVTAETLNLRAGPGSRHRVRGKLARAEKVAVIDADAGGEWLAVRTIAGREGYVSARFLSTEPGGDTSAALPTS